MSEKVNNTIGIWVNVLQMQLLKTKTKIAKRKNLKKSFLSPLKE